MTASTTTRRGSTAARALRHGRQPHRAPARARLARADATTSAQTVRRDRAAADSRRRRRCSPGPRSASSASPGVSRVRVDLLTVRTDPGSHGEGPLQRQGLPAEDRREHAGHARRSFACAGSSAGCAPAPGSTWPSRGRASSDATSASSCVSKKEPLRRTSCLYPGRVHGRGSASRDRSCVNWCSCWCSASPPSAPCSRRPRPTATRAPSRAQAAKPGRRRRRRRPPPSAWPTSAGPSRCPPCACASPSRRRRPPRRPSRSRSWRRPVVEPVTPAPQVYTPPPSTPAPSNPSPPPSRSRPELRRLRLIR